METSNATYNDHIFIYISTFVIGYPKKNTNVLYLV